MEAWNQTSALIAAMLAPYRKRPPHPNEFNPWAGTRKRVGIPLSVSALKAYFKLDGKTRDNP